MSENALTVVTENKYALLPAMDLEMALARRQAVIDFVGAAMQKDVHFGTIPGTKKDVLYKAGAEMLTTFFGLSPRFVQEECTEDWSGEEHGGEPFFFYRYRCQLWRGDLLAGEGLGSCNSWERKYRFRSAGRVCPECGSDALKRSNYPPRGAPEGTKKGWWCDSRNGGCGEDFYFEDESIQGQDGGKVKNDNPQDLVNTIDKMAQKRALVAATLIAVNASEFFTQDLEDMDLGAVQGEYTEVSEDEEPQKEKAKAKAKATNANGRKAKAQPAPERDPLAQAIDRVRKSGRNFFPALVDVTGWEQKDLKEAAKTLGMEKIHGDERRLAQFRTVHEYARLVEEGIEGGLAIAVVNGALTHEEALAQMEALEAVGDEEE